MGPAVEALSLTKRFKQLTAVAGLDLSIQPKEIFGLLGPDGAGKTTLLRMLSTAMEPTDGQARVLGMDVKVLEEDIRRRIGYMPQRFSLYGDMSVDENIEFFAEIFQVEDDIWRRRKEELLSFTQLAPFKKRRTRNLSGGMQKKLALACSLIHTPEVLFLDEPTTGVDPISRRQFWHILEGLPDMTIVVATPYMDEAERCHRVGLMREGKLLMVDTPENIKARTGTRSLEQAFIKLVEK
jgi:ABC-2 type transport system ATP-binding protein